MASKAPPRRPRLSAQARPPTPKRFRRPPAVCITVHGSSAETGKAPAMGTKALLGLRARAEKAARPNRGTTWVEPFIWKQHMGVKAVGMAGVQKERLPQERILNSYVSVGDASFAEPPNVFRSE